MAGCRLQQKVQLCTRLNYRMQAAAITLLVQPLEKAGMHFTIITFALERKPLIPESSVMLLYNSPFSIQFIYLGKF